MADKRKAKLKYLEKRLAILKAKYPDINLDDTFLLECITEYHIVRREAFFLKFEIEHCPKCSQLLPKYHSKPK